MDCAQHSPPASTDREKQCRDRLCQATLHLGPVPCLHPCCCAAPAVPMQQAVLSRPPIILPNTSARSGVSTQQSGVHLQHRWAHSLSS